MVRRMNDETKKRLTFDHSPAERDVLVRQVADAEVKGFNCYHISVASAWYDIVNGRIKNSGKKIQ